MNNYVCSYCGGKLELGMEQFTVTRKLHGQVRIVGNVCCGCENKIEVLVVWIVGSDDLGWYVTDSYKDAVKVFLNEVKEDNNLIIEIYKDYMFTAEFQKLGEFEGF